MWSFKSSTPLSTGLTDNLPKESRLLPAGGDISKNSCAESACGENLPKEPLLESSTGVGSSWLSAPASSAGQARSLSTSAALALHTGSFAAWQEACLAGSGGDVKGSSVAFPARPPIAGQAPTALAFAHGVVHVSLPQISGQGATAVGSARATDASLSLPPTSGQEDISREPSAATRTKSTSPSSAAQSWQPAGQGALPLAGGP
mmetsp:Transcript_4874/g.13533  ORF Transcript_4874/g.13533 Transcript_4874/m.13533 type:complete len:204 (+) Transcript_4874:1278-1889(+)